MQNDTTTHYLRSGNQQTGSGRFIASDLDLFGPLPRLRQIIGGLQAQPRISPTPKGHIKPDGHFGRNPPPSVHQIVEGLPRHPKVFGPFGYGQP